MGACCGKDSDSRRYHIKTLINRARRREASQSSSYLKPGTVVIARWGEEWYPAVVCSDRGEEVDLTWDDNSVTKDIPREQVKVLPIYEQGEMVEAKWENGWQPAVIIQRTAGTYEIEWQDHSRSIDMPTAELKKPSFPIRPFPGVKYPPKPEGARIHGVLRIVIESARNLPDSDTTIFCGKKPGDPFCEMFDGSGRLITRTKVVDDVSSPIWDHRAAEAGVMVPDTDVLHFCVKDQDVSSNEIVSEAVLTTDNGLEILASGKPFSGWVPLRTASGKFGGELNIWLQLKPPAHPSTTIHEIQGTRYPLTHSNKVTLYQSAHVGQRHRERLSHVPLYEKRTYRREDCWIDIAKRIMQAKQFIYIMGWSVDAHTRLVREAPITVEPYGEISTSMTLGEMLIKKANEGVTVCIMVWKEATSTAGTPGGLFENDGVAGTKSSQTIAYFKNTSVTCVGVLRNGVGLLSNLTLTHHQKGAMMDAGSNNRSGKRRVVAFIGGLDLTGGRWDTPGKEIFATLDREHIDDCYQTMTTFETHSHGVPEGPRQPWQDVHCQVEGPAAHDIVQNFENRWKTQANNNSALYDVGTSARILKPADDIPGGRGHDAWDVQLLRSIDKFSDNTVQGIEADCHQAWVKSIENAQRFVYIENQFFMGASDKWLKGNNKNTSWNRIPDVIITRILLAIRRGEPFAVYVVLPLFPEGDPSSKTVQEMIHWQFQTVAAMYHHIGLALKKAQSTRVPTDYLNFFCLGQTKLGEAKPVQPLRPQDKSRKAQILRNARVPIYVHSKMLLVDDEIVIIGSCNVNDRSMAGDRDTEIAVAMSQPGHSRTTNKKPHGVVHAYRLSLWTEHLCLTADKGKIPSCILQPQSIECVRYVNEISLQSWNQHAAHDASQVCHLMKYPYAVRADGSITPAQKYLPDTVKAKTLGRSSRLVPDWLTA
eukprot:TRINITY_DN9129_c0_g5_i2.p1 TRINITY_DN9129_c0_g5~~TRINITY_DN9129_c0_g5_i2.p1  ORF type:complete len:950 (+),score=92.63 TRINITY_DN9129_c0_g5_i2:56-2851(+)